MSLISRSLSLCCAVSAIVTAADQVAPVMAKDLSALDLTGLDRSRPLTQLGYEYESTTVDETGTDGSRHIVRGGFAAGLFGAAIDVPVSCRYNPGAGNTVNNGFGDVVLSGTIGAPVDDRLRVAGGIDLSLDTASRDELGNQATLLTPLVAVGYTLDKQTRATGAIRYTGDVTRQSGIEATRRLEFRFGGIRTMDQLFGGVEGRLANDMEGRRTLFTVVVSAGLEVTPHHVLRIGTAQPFDRYTREHSGWQSTFDYAFVF